MNGLSCKLDQLDRCCVIYIVYLFCHGVSFHVSHSMFKQQTWVSLASVVGGWVVISLPDSRFSCQLYHDARVFTCQILPVWSVTLPKMRINKSHQYVVYYSLRPKRKKRQSLRPKRKKRQPLEKKKTTFRFMCPACFRVQRLIVRLI